GAAGMGEVGEAGVIAPLGMEPRAPSSGPGLDRLLVADLTDRDTAGDEPGPLGREVGRDETEVAHPPGRARRDQLHRAARPGRSELHHPEVDGRMVVDVEDEAGSL